MYNLNLKPDPFSRLLLLKGSVFKILPYHMYSNKIQFRNYATISFKNLIIRKIVKSNYKLSIKETHPEHKCNHYQFFVSWLEEVRPISEIKELFNQSHSL